jgi:hypothetical protein
MKPTHCPYCNRHLSYAPVVKGAQQPLNLATRDHVVPRCKGGGGSRVNQHVTVYCCNACNQDKGSLTLNEWRAALSWRHMRPYVFAFEWRMLKNFPRDVAYKVAPRARWLVTC